MRSSWSLAYLFATFHLCHSSFGQQALKSHAVPPGDTPFKFCNDSKSTDIFTFDLIQLHPKPLLLDQIFHVNIYGTFSQDIPVNSTLKVRGVYENYEPGHTFTVNFCEPDIIYSVDQPGNNKCPPKKGGVLMIFEYYTSPWDLGPGNYSWTFEAFTPQQERLFCIEAKLCLDRGDGDPRSGDACPPVKDRSYVEETQRIMEL